MLEPLAKEDSELVGVVTASLRQSGIAIHVLSKECWGRIVYTKEGDEWAEDGRPKLYSREFFMNSNMEVTFRETHESPMFHDPLNEEILEILNAVRGKFKTVVALLGMHHEYNPKETTLGLSF